MYGSSTTHYNSIQTLTIYIYIILAKTKTNIMNNLTVVILSYLLQRTIVHPIALIMTKVLVT